MDQQNTHTLQKKNNKIHSDDHKKLNTKNLGTQLALETLARLICWQKSFGPVKSCTVLPGRSWEPTKRNVSSIKINYKRRKTAQCRPIVGGSKLKS